MNQSAEREAMESPEVPARRTPRSNYHHPALSST